MLTELVIALLTTLEATSSQYAPVYASQYYQAMPQYYQERPTPQEEEYEDKRSSDKYGNSEGGSNEYESNSDECKCSCAACKDRFRPVKSCCIEFCYSCPADPIYSAEPIYNMPVSVRNPGNFVFVPYPYPMMLPNSIKNTTTTTTTSTTTEETTKVTINTTPSKIASPEPQNIPELIRRLHATGSIKNSLETNDNTRSPKGLRAGNKYMMTNMRKVKPTWESKFGIVPIPDNLAEKLMSQLRQVKELQQPRRF